MFAVGRLSLKVEMQFRREIIDGCNVRGGVYNGPDNALGKANGTQLSIVTYSQEFDKKKTYQVVT